MSNLVNDKTKNLIISHLGASYPHSAKEVFRSLGKKQKVTYQAIYKSLRELCEQEIVVKDGVMYSLQSEWVRGQFNEFSDISMRYNHFSDSVNPEAIVQLFTFNSFNQARDFLEQVYDKQLLNQSNDDTVYIQVRRLSPIIIVCAQGIVETIKKIRSKNRVLIACRNNQRGDRISAKYLRSLGIEVVTDVPVHHFNTVLYGDCIVQYYSQFDSKVREDLDGYHDSFRAVSMRTIKFARYVLEQNFTINVLINRNRNFVEDVKKTTKMHFSQ